MPNHLMPLSAQWMWLKDRSNWPRNDNIKAPSLLKIQYGMTSDRLPPPTLPSEASQQHFGNLALTSAL
jgi:hypothetical protein